jgi:hypothetical protein
LRFRADQVNSWLGSLRHDCAAMFASGRSNARVKINQAFTRAY